MLWYKAGYVIDNTWPIELCFSYGMFDSVESFDQVKIRDETVLGSLAVFSRESQIQLLSVTFTKKSDLLHKILDSCYNSDGQLAVTIQLFNWWKNN